jgi:hypothetical protein
MIEAAITTVGMNAILEGWIIGYTSCIDELRTKKFMQGGIGILV